MQNFCFILSLQASCIIISAIFLTLGIVVLLVNLPYLELNIFFVILLLWVFMMISTSISSFFSAYLESSAVTLLTLFFLSLSIIYWLSLSVTQFLVEYDHGLISNICSNYRCPESLWLIEFSKNADKKPVVINRNKKHHNTAFLNDDIDFISFFTNKFGNAEKYRSIAKRENGKNHTNENLLYKNDINNTKYAETASNSLLLNLFSLSQIKRKVVKPERGFTNDTQPRIKMYKRKANANRDHLKPEVEVYKGSSDKSKQISVFDKNFSRMIDLNNVPGLQIKHELNGSNEFSYPVVKNRETKIISRRAANEFTMTSVALIVMNTMFFMYCWCAIYSYWRLVSRGFVSDVSSDESDTQSSATTVKTNQEEN